MWLGKHDSAFRSDSGGMKANAGTAESGFPKKNYCRNVKKNCGRKKNLLPRKKTKKRHLVKFFFTRCPESKKNSNSHKSSYSDNSFKIQRVSVYINKNQTYINVEKCSKADMKLLGKKKKK